MRIYLDSNVIIGALSSHETNSTAAQKLMRQVASGEHQAIVSSLAFGEILSLKNGSQDLNLGQFFAQLKNIQSIAADDALCTDAGILRKLRGLKLPDAIHLATALSARVDLFITNDKQLAAAAKDAIPVKTLAQLNI